MTRLSPSPTQCTGGRSRVECPTNAAGSAVRSMSGCARRWYGAKVRNMRCRQLPVSLKREKWHSTIAWKHSVGMRFSSPHAWRGCCASYVFLILALGSTLYGCGGSRRVVTERPTLLPLAGRTRAKVTTELRVRVVSPSPTTVEHSSFTVRAYVAKPRFAASRTHTAPADYGYLRIALDNGRYDEPYYTGVGGRLGVRSGVNGFYTPVHGHRLRYRDIPGGWHTVEVTAVSQNSSSAGPPVVVHFRVA